MEIVKTFICEQESNHFMFDKEIFKVHKVANGDYYKESEKGALTKMVTEVAQQLTGEPTQEQLYELLSKSLDQNSSRIILSDTTARAYCFECEIEMPIVWKKDFPFCKNCGLAHKVLFRD